MVIPIKIKKLANHWYPVVEHNNANEIQLDERVENILVWLAKDRDEIEIVFYEQYDIIADLGNFEFNEEDINRYMTTNDSFDMRFYVDEHEFLLSSDLYTLLEQQYEFDFHINLYRIEIW